MRPLVKFIFKYWEWSTGGSPWTGYMKGSMD